MGHFDSLEIFDAGIRIPTGAAAGLIAQSDASGNLSWARPGQPAALTGATAATRYVGGTASGPPVSGTFAVGDFIVDQTGIVWVCTVAGTPGTWQSQAATELGYADIASNVAGISAQADVAGLSITFATGGRPAMIEAHFPLLQQVSSSGTPTLYISDASNSELGRCSPGLIAAGGVLGGISAKCRIPANTASATYHVRAQTSAGTLTLVAAASPTQHRHFITACSR